MWELSAATSNSCYFHGVILHGVIILIIGGFYMLKKSLRRLDLLKSNLKNIPERTFEFSSSSFRELVLTSSNISNIEPNAIKGLKAGSLWLNGNLLKGLDESAFRPILTEVGSLYLAGNPLSCGV
ncbi:uncharacterized protein LOC122266822 [Penaeus japonicus]|uniref:uncharacterized protein LOC122266822 n=1 Tax=Penaeus japonicus TaxID=27405 RepID=UPI001C70DC9B|nr:uncharacterized protein LOC122266822 [Penaeus japonicus]